MPRSTDSSSSSILKEMVEMDLSISKMLILLLPADALLNVLSAPQIALWFLASPLAHSSSQ